MFPKSLRSMAVLCVGTAVLGGCRQSDHALGGIVDSAVLGTAQAAAPAAAMPALQKKTLWMEYPANAAPPQGVVPMASLAPLVKLVKPGVVNVYTTSVVRLRPPHRQLPPGMQDPFEEFFRRFSGPEESRRQSLGSGFIIHPDGLVVTNNHVVEGATEIRVRLDDGREFEAGTVGRDPKTDLALLKLKSEKPLHDLPTVTLGNSDPLEVGDFVLAVGNPFGLDHSVSLGIVSAKERVIGAGPYDEFIQTDAAINPGNSGGPLFNTRGEVVGVNTAIVAQGQGIGFAVPINIAKEVLPQLSERGRVVRGWLGVTIQDITPEIASSLKLADVHGALVAGVMRASPADKADLRAGDVVVAVNGRKVETHNQLSRYVAFVAPGSRAALTVIRDGRQRAIEVTVGERPEDEESAQSGGNGDPQVAPTGKDRLGIAVQPLAPQKAQRMGVDGGVQIADVEADGPAGRAGARAGDIIVEMQRQPTRSVKDYSAVVASLKARDMALLRLQRENASIYVAVRTAE